MKVINIDYVMLDSDVDGTISDADVTETTLASKVCLLPFPLLLSAGNQIP